MILESNHVVAGLHQVFLPELNNGIRHPAGDGINQADRTHRTEPQRVAPAPRDLFDGQARFEVTRLFELVNPNAFRRDQGFVESVIFLPVHWAIQIIIGCVAVPAPAVDLRVINCFGVDDRANRVVEVKVFRTAETADGFGKGW